MAVHDVLHYGGERLRLGPWRNDGDIGYLAPVPGAEPPRAGAIRRSLDIAAGRGFRAVVTAALAPREADPFVEAGFTPREQLHLLAHDLHHLPTAAATATRRARRTDRARVIHIDRRAFDTFWALDSDGLDDAIGATPHSRFRVIETLVDGERAVVGYAVHGRAGSTGYVQRIGVDPTARGLKLGYSVVLDGLKWMKRRGCVRALVNTQRTNTTALALYENMGFRHEAYALTVFERAIDPLA